MDNQNSQRFESIVRRFYQPGTPTKDAQQKVIGELEQALNQLAANGWRLVTTAPTREPAERDYIFERPL